MTKSEIYKGTFKELKQDLRRAKLDKEKSLKDFEYYSKEVILLEEAIREFTSN